MHKPSRPTLRKRVRTNSSRGHVYGSLVFVAVLIVLSFIGLPKVFSSRYTTFSNSEESTSTQPVTSTKKEEKPLPMVAQHLKTPDPLKGIYMTQCVAGTPSFRDRLIDLIKETELNAVVIDVKDFSGKLGWNATDPELVQSVSDECGAADMQALVKRLHENGIYTIARITVFQDPFYAVNMRPDLAVQRASDGSVWRDKKGLSFIDVGAKPFWDYIVTLSTQAYLLGFDELNFDYVRYPSDGNLQDIIFPWTKGRDKEDVLEEFFAYLHDKLSNPKTFYTDERLIEKGDVPVLSADLFGMTTTAQDGMGIGQVLERALPYFDYIMPMVYPSHYPNGFQGYANPAAHPYDIIELAMQSGVARADALQASLATTSTSTEIVRLRSLAEKGHGDISHAQLRPWLQDFDLGATYTPDMVRAQMQATYDVGLTSWILWNAGNNYTRSALLPGISHMVE